jgi:hypothetical protein
VRSVLIHEDDFSDLAVCTFWLAPHSPLRTYRMRTYTARVWINTTLSFYAASPGSNGGFYDVDNVSMTYEPTGFADRTLCDDPTAPLPIAAPNGPNLLGNGDFSAGMGPWDTFHGLQHQLSNGVFEFIWAPAPPPAPGVAPSYPRFEPAPVVIQRTGMAMTAGEILTARFDLGNSSTVRKRVSVLIHQWDFNDLAACAFWLEPGTPLQTTRCGCSAEFGRIALSVMRMIRPVRSAGQRLAQRRLGPKWRQGCLNNEIPCEPAARPVVGTRRTVGVDLSVAVCGSRQTPPQRVDAACPCPPRRCAMSCRRATAT